MRILPSDDPADLKADSSPSMDNEMTAKERGILEEDNEKEEMDQEQSQEDEGEERKLREEEGVENKRKEHEPLTEEQELEELKAQVLQLLLELEEARETSNKHQESFHELQGERFSLYTGIFYFILKPHHVENHESDNKQGVKNNSAFKKYSYLSKKCLITMINVNIFLLVLYVIDHHRAAQNCEVEKEIHNLFEICEFVLSPFYSDTTK